MKNYLLSFVLLTAVVPALGNKISESVYTNAPFVMDVSGGMIIGGGEALPGADIQIAGNLKADFPLYLGGELGLFFTTGRYSSGAVIPILAKIYTPVRISPRAYFRIGGSMGPVIATSSGYSGAGFAFLIDPAIIFGLSGRTDLSAQARFGVMGGTFVAMPQLGLTFAI